MSKFNIAEAYRNLINEYKKIHWPDKVEVFHVTVIVLLITIFVSLLTLTFDVSFDFILNSLTTTMKSILGGAL